MNYNITNKSEKISKYVTEMSAKYDWFCPNSWGSDDIAVNFCCKAFMDDNRDVPLVIELINHMPQWLRQEAADACLSRIKDYSGEMHDWDYVSVGSRINYYALTAQLFLN